MMRTRTGEISVDVRTLRVLAKALSPLPVVKEQEVDGKIIAYGGFTDVEERYRQRYADLAVNADVREVFRKRAQTISAVRRFLDGEGFLEVETPILQAVYGGAAGAAVHHASQSAQAGFVSAHQLRAVLEALVGRHVRRRLRDRARFPQ
jgi:lysyl-tRNA synthetase class II